MLCENFYQMSIGLKRTALAAGLAAASIISPVKADDSGFYLTGSVGVSNQDESTWTSRSDSTVKGKVDFDESAGVFNGGLGYDFGSFRVEATLGKTNGDLDKYQVTGPTKLAAADASGNYTLKSAFLSGYYDISLGDKLNAPLFIKKRQFKFFWKLLEILKLKKTYRHNNSTNESFLINPDDN